MDDPMRHRQIVVSKPRGEKHAQRRRASACPGLPPQRLRGCLSGDLDAIIAMAMRKEPDRRYPSVEAFADDVNRHLLGQPARARQGDWRYNTSKFMRRHFWAVAGVLAAFVGLSLFAGVTLWQNHRIELARDATAQERDRAQQVSAFLVDVFSQADPFKAQGKHPTPKDVLDRGAAKIMGNPALQPEMRAELLESIGLAYRHQGVSERAIPLFEQAVAIRRQERPLDNARIAVAEANLARALTDAGNLTSAEMYLEKAVTLSQSAKESQNVGTADILVQFGHFALDAKSDPARAIQLFSKALNIYHATIGDQSLQMAQVLNGLASAAARAGDYPQAEAYQREALAFFQATVSRNHPDNAAGLATLGYILTQLGKYVEAEQVLNEALQIE